VGKCTQSTDNVPNPVANIQQLLRNLAAVNYHY